MATLNQGLSLARPLDHAKSDLMVGRISRVQSAPGDGGEPEMVAKEIESLFATLLVSEMRKGLGDGFFGSGAGSDTFNGWFDEEIGASLFLPGLTGTRPRRCTRRSSERSQPRTPRLSAIALRDEGRRRQERWTRHWICAFARPGSSARRGSASPARVRDAGSFLLRPAPQAARWAPLGGHPRGRCRPRARGQASRGPGEIRREAHGPRVSGSHELLERELERLPFRKTQRDRILKDLAAAFGAEPTALTLRSAAERLGEDGGALLLERDRLRAVVEDVQRLNRRVAALVRMHREVTREILNAVLGDGSGADLHDGGTLIDAEV